MTSKLDLKDVEAALQAKVCEGILEVKTIDGKDYYRKKRGMQTTT